MGTIIDSSSAAPKRQTVNSEQIAAALRALLRGGLPVDLKRAGEVLPNLRSVVARSVHPDDLVSRLDALNQLLVRFLAEAGDDERGEAMRVLFGLAKGSGARNLTQRRASAAALLDYDPDHFRKHVEPALLLDLAVTIHRDLLRYKSRAKRAPGSLASYSLEPTGDTPSLNETHFTHQEELVSRIWEKVYALRAEHIAVGRRERAAGAAALGLEIEEHRQAADRNRAYVDALVREFIDTYGEQFIQHGEVEYSIDAVRRLTP
jgi:hypothetical protein